MFVINLPTLTDYLVILNCPHPTGIIRELVHNPQRQEQRVETHAPLLLMSMPSPDTQDISSYPPDQTSLSQPMHKIRLVS